MENSSILRSLDTRKADAGYQAYATQPLSANPSAGQGTLRHPRTGLTVSKVQAAPAKSRSLQEGLAARRPKSWYETWYERTTCSKVFRKWPFYGNYLGSGGALPLFRTPGKPALSSPIFRMTQFTEVSESSALRPQKAISGSGAGDHRYRRESNAGAVLVASL
jgi:hypothetical protein